MRSGERESIQRSSADVWDCGCVRQRDDMEMHAGVYTEIYQPVTDQIEHRKGILGVGVGIQVEPCGVFPLYETKGRLWIDGRDAGLDLCNGVLHRIVPWIDAHEELSSRWRYVVTACTKVCALRTACC